MNFGTFWRGCAIALTFTAQASAMTTYHVGNSLTWDSSPGTIEQMAVSQGYDHSYGHHIRCNSSLTQITSDPTGTCVSPTDFGTYGAALPDNAWEAVTLQVFPGGDATINSETDSILTLINSAQTNPANDTTRFYIYTGWAPQSGLYTSWTATVTDADTTPALRQREVMSHVLHRVRDAADADVLMVPVGDVIYQLGLEIEAGDIPGATDVSALYRDDVHMSYDIGRYTAAATTFATLYGHDLTDVTRPNGFAEDSPFSIETTDAINKVVWDVVSTHEFSGVPEPSTAVVLGVSFFCLLGRKRREA